MSRPDLGAGMAVEFWAVFGCGDKRLKAALSPDQMLAMDNLLEVMKAASRAVYTGTDTAAKESAKETLQKLEAQARFVMGRTIPGALRHRLAGLPMPMLESSPTLSRTRGRLRR